MIQGPHRVNAGGRVDRDRPVAFSLDGRPLSGYRGDTLASALLGCGVRIVGRSFKYHRPRGFLSAGVDEPNGLFTLGEGGRTEPNAQGTVVELTHGLLARSQNAWPSVRFDLGAVNSWAGPVLQAGFYYKTFMGPTRRAWMFYERFIRRAAGLGKGSHEPDPDRYESRYAFTDVLVIGAGPAGLSAALAAGRAGARVMLVEQDGLLGGTLLTEPATGDFESWRARMESELRSRPEVEILRHTTALGVYDGNTVVLVTRRAHDEPDARRGHALQIVTTARAKAVVHATGAVERPLVFPNNDRPGVMLASAARAYLNRYAVACGNRIVVLTNNDSAYAAAFDLAPHADRVAVADVRRVVDPSLLKRASDLGIEVHAGTAVADVRGRAAVHGVVLGPAAGGKGEVRIDCDLLCMSGGWSPLVHLSSHGGIKPLYREDSAAFVPGGYASGHFGAGAVTGSFSLRRAVEEGREAGIAAAAHGGLNRISECLPIAPEAAAPWATANHRIEPVWQLPGARAGKAFVDFQSDVTARDLAVAHQEGYRSVEHLKRYTTLGMGTDQGKTSNINALAIMAALRGLDLAAAGTTTFRPPFTPVRMGALAGRHVGQHFRPARRSPLHGWHLANGAEMIEAGPWLRPWYYHWAGDTVERAYLEEMRLVRSAVGLSDVSTLGKIDVQGPDAAEFLDRVYVNGFKKLPVGKARYGVMLNDAGTILDDGTTTRLTETRYFMTTTTAGAAEVMSWLEFLQQAAWPQLRVHVTSVTDEWAGMAIAGPEARAALERALPGNDFSNAAVPHMGCVEVELDRVPVRVIRLSFSGELAYELYVPADYGTAFWEHLLASGASFGMRPYGLEALASLRIEKGHIAGVEVDPRLALSDVGLGRMAKPEKPFIGRELAARPLLTAAARPSLVGLECLEPGKRLRGGAILFAASDEIKGHGRGYVTSVTWSPTLGKFIALGLYSGGLDHVGEEIVCAFPLYGERVRARITSPVFLDPKGERLHV
jgi:heterotetrameric sarcosine oxidase alpha subunit